MMTPDALVLIQSAVVRAACEQRTEQDLVALRASLAHAASVPDGESWERRAAAHAEFHNLLADATGNPVLAILVRSITSTLRDVMVAGGPAAGEVIVSSRGRLLHHLRARDAESAAGEIEENLGRLVAMGRRASPADPADPADPAGQPVRTGARPRGRRGPRERTDSILLSRQLSELPRVGAGDSSYPRRVG
jgi:DNA-binding GntR family transcriptional regulator